MFASCQIVQGRKRSAIYDLERSAFYDLPNEFLHILEYSRDNTVAELTQQFGDNQGAIETFLDQFVQQELGFYTSEPDRFPAIDLSWESPHWITNSVIEWSDSAGFEFEQVIGQLDQLACPSIQIRILKDTDHQKIAEILTVPFKETRFNYVELLLPFSAGLSHEDLYDLISRQPRLYVVSIYGAAADRIVEHDNPQFNKRIVYFKKDIRTEPFEIIKLDRFFTNINLHAEAMHYNTGLNRKVCIDINGNIKNYISHDRLFGNIRSEKLSDVIQSASFQQIWHISNDKVEICKDCQYRYACVSNSDLKQIENKYYKIDMCGFVPATNTWTTGNEHLD